jgi:dTDP-4-amino-4,6-dideoxy-D-galactose acyltransferase
MMDTGEICKFLDWDSRFFGFRIARINVHRLNEAIVDSISKWSRLHLIDCLYFLADAGDADSVILCEENGLRFVDIRITLEKQLGIETNNQPDTMAHKIIRPSILSDVPELKAIAKINHHDSRFYFDNNFPTALCDSLYETWIEKSCNAYADIVFVAVLEGKPAGYVSCHLLNKQKGQIGLLGVSPAFRGNSLGKALVIESLQWFAWRGVTHITVVTQGRNCKALYLYQKCGFLIQSIQLWYHWWFSKEA